MAGGRPTDYTPELATRICQLIASNPISVKRICAKYPELPSQDTVYAWLARYPEFSGQYLDAKEKQALTVADDLWDEIEKVVPVTEEINLFNAKFRFQQWHLSKLAPKQFGDKKENKTEVNLVIHEDTLKSLK